MDIGFYVTNIQGSNKDLIIKTINEYVDNHPYDNVVMFNDNYDTITNNNFYTLHISHAKYFKGILLVFDINDIFLARGFPAPKRKIFFSTEPYWQNHKTTPYKMWSQVFNNPEIDIVVNNQSSFDIYKICWKQPIHLMNNMNSQEIEHVLQKI